jgi:hypothetical protein
MTVRQLDYFVAANREEIVTRCRAKVATRSLPIPIEAEIDHGVPRFLDQLMDALRLGERSTPDIGRSAVQHGHDLLLQGFTVAQVVHAYGDICQSITELAVEADARISPADFRTLNRCLDEPRGCGHGVRPRTESVHSRRRDRARDRAARVHGS